jgi:site-specific DNA-methyltransferase (adenine-specific)
VWDFATVQAYAGKHPCEKPLGLLRHIILASSRPGDTVLDCFAGSGSTLDAARQCGRKAIGIEQDAGWVARITRRLQQEDLFSAAVVTSTRGAAPTQASLFP